jgi:hypothetical protein
MKSMSNPTKRRRSGSSTIEFVLVASLFLVPLILGLFSIGFGLIRGMNGIQLTRDVGHMWAGGVDFSKQANQDLMASQLAQGLSIVSNSGNVTGGSTGQGVVVFSTYTNLGNSCPTCANAGHIVLIRRVVVGNNTVFQSAYGLPLSSSVNATTGDITNYSNDLSARADNFTNLMSLTAGEIAYFTESYFTAPDLALPGLFPGLAMYSNAIF